MSIRRRNPREQGDIGVGAAIAYFLSKGLRVFVPLSESQPYDLVVDDGSGPQRVQVKTTTSRDRRGRFLVQVCTRGGNQSWSGVARYFDQRQIEWLFVLTDAEDRYLIPAYAITARTKLTLGNRMEPYRLPGSRQGLSAFQLSLEEVQHPA